MSDKNKSGYELRTDLLGMAMEHLHRRNNRRETNEHFKAENGSGYQRQPIQPYEIDDVLEVASKLYEFVKKK